MSDFVFGPMLSIINRLKKEKDFAVVFKGGKRINGDRLFLQIFPNGLKVSRFGFVVGKTISKKATLRNLLKRRLRALVQKCLSSLSSGYDVVMVTRPGLEKKNIVDLEKILIEVFRKSGILR